MCMHAITMDRACTLVALLLPTFGKRAQDQRNTSRKRTTTTSSSTEQRVHHLGTTLKTLMRTAQSSVAYSSTRRFTITRIMNMEHSADHYNEFFYRADRRRCNDSYHRARGAQPAHRTFSIQRIYESNLYTGRTDCGGDQSSYRPCCYSQKSWNSGYLGTWRLRYLG